MNKTMQRLCQTAARLMHKCKKSAVTVLYIYGLLLIWYLPFLAVIVVEAISGAPRSVKIAYDLTTAVVFINSSVNPIIYCWRLKQVRRAVKHYLSIIEQTLASALAIKKRKHVHSDTRVNIGSSSVGDKKSGHRWRDIRCSEATLFATSDWAKNISHTWKASFAASDWPGFICEQKFTTLFFSEYVSVCK